MLEEVKKTYKYCKYSGKKYAKYLYQKKIWDYYINCFVFDTWLQFEAQLNKNWKVIDIMIVSWYETIEDVERLFQEQRTNFAAK